MAVKTKTSVSVANEMSKQDGSSSVNADVEAGTTVPSVHGELKRDLASRHINMIALAGMIVGSPWRSHNMELLTISSGHRAVSWLRPDYCNCWTRRCTFGLSSDGHCCCWCIVYHWRGHCIFSRYRRFCASCHSICRACPRCSCWVEFL